MRRLLLLLLFVTPALAATGHAKVEHGGWFASGSYFQFEGSKSTADPECLPALRYEVKDRYGFGVGLGYQFASGWSLEGSWLRLHEDAGASAGRFATGWGEASDGFMVTGRVPLRFFVSPCCR